MTQLHERLKSGDPMKLATGEKILKALGRYYYLSGRQVRDLLFDRESEASRKYAVEWLTGLTNGGYAIAVNSSPNPVTGKPNIWIWERTEKGQKTLAGLGYPSPVRVPEKK